MRMLITLKNIIRIVSLQAKFFFSDVAFSMYD